MFITEQEAELKDYLIHVEGQLFGLTTKELRGHAERNNIKHPFNPAAISARRDWIKVCFARNPTLAIRKPEVRPH